MNEIDPNSEEVAKYLASLFKKANPKIGVRYELVHGLGFKSWWEIKSKSGFLIACYVFHDTDRRRWFYYDNYDFSPPNEIDLCDEESIIKMFKGWSKARLS